MRHWHWMKVGELRKKEVDELRHKRNVLSSEIASATEDNRGELINEASKLKEKILARENKVTDTKNRRDSLLLSIGYELENLEDDEFVLKTHNLWDIIDVEKNVNSEIKLADFTVPLLIHLLEVFGIESEVYRSSQLPVKHPGDASTYLANITEYFDGSTYLSGKVGYNQYLSEHIFEDKGLEVDVQDWTPSWPDGNVSCLEVMYSTSNPGEYIR